MKKLILIRHGETDYTLQKKYCGHEDIPLNDKGIEQAMCLGKKLRNMKIDNIYSSDLRRAFQTAEMVFQNRFIFKRKALREIDFGAFSGLTFEEVGRIYPTRYKIWINDPLRAKIPRGESLRILSKRVEGTFKRIANQNSGKTIALVSHGGPIRIILLKILKQGLDKFWTIEQNPAAINIIDFKNGVPKVLRVNDTSYLY